MFRLLSLRRSLPVLSPKTGGVSIRTFSGTAVLASQRSKVFEDFRKEIGLNYAERTVPVKELLEGLKTLQAERLVTNNNEKSAHYRDGFRDIMQICTPGQTELTIRQIEEVLTPENSVTWRAVRDLAIDGEIPEVSALECLPTKKIAVEFSQIYGIGREKALNLADWGYETFDDLRSKDVESRKLLAKGSKLALEHFEDMQKLIPRKEMEIFDTVVRETLYKADPKIQFELMGMYRRGERLSQDIDIVIWHEDYVKAADDDRAKAIMLTVKNALLKAGLMGSENTFMDGPKKSLFLTRVPPSHSHLLASEDGEPAAMRKMEVRVCAMESLPYFRLANTGDDMLMRIFRSVAKGRGLVINEYGMGAKRKGGEGSKNSTWAEAGTSIPATCERDIFDYLGIPYLEPTQRSFKHYEKIFSAHPSARHILGL